MYKKFINLICNVFKQKQSKSYLTEQEFKNILEAPIRLNPSNEILIRHIINRTIRLTLKHNKQARNYYNNIYYINEINKL